MMKFSLFACALTTAATTVLAWPSEELNSREFKAMLNASLFASDSEADREDTVMAVLEELQKDLTKIAAGAKAVDTSGEFELKDDTPRLVRYYDTPGDCHLRRNGLTVRLRRPLDEWTDDPWEGMLKARNGDRYHTTVRAPYVQGCNHEVSDEKKHKFEEDVSHFDWTGSIFSFSQKCWFYPTKMPKESRNNLQMVATVWENAQDFMEGDLGFDMSAPLAIVSNTTITEIAYEDFWIFLDADDYGDDDAMAQAKVTLWYKTQEGLKTDGGSSQLPEFTGVGNPIVAELSFRIKSLKEAWTDDTIINMHNFWEMCGKSLANKWLDPHSMTKTSWIYKYNPLFCTPEDADGDES